MSLISIKNVNSWYGDKQMLKNINMEIEKNKITSFIGPSACGKTTLLKSLNRMNDLIESFRISGDILFGDTNIYKDIKKSTDVMWLRQQIGMVFQNPNPLPMSIYKNLKLPLSEKHILTKEEEDNIILTNLKNTHIYEEIKDRIHKSALALSGGQQQRLCIARCLCQSPQVILLDEPCSALDPISTSKIEDLLLELKEKYTIVIVTHNMAQARRISDNVGFFYQGELVEYSDCETFFYSPKKELTQNYLKGVF